MGNRNLHHFYEFTYIPTEYFQKWRLPCTTPTPVVGTLLSNNLPIQVSSGPSDPEIWQRVKSSGTVAHFLQLKVIHQTSCVQVPSHISIPPPRVGVSGAVLSLLSAPTVADFPPF